MFPAIERRSGRSRYTSVTRSSSSSATRCSPTSTEIKSSRFASGRGARRAGWRRRSRPPERCVVVLRELRSGPFCFAAGAASRAGSSGFSGVSGVSGVSAPAPGLRRPRPPRLPRRRRFRAAAASVAGVSSSGSSAAGSSGGAGASSSAAAASAACSSSLRRRNRNQGNPQVSSCKRARAHDRSCGAPRAASGVKISGHRPAARLAARPATPHGRCRLAGRQPRRQRGADAPGARELPAGAG